MHNNHLPLGWNEELNWIVRQCNRKWWKMDILKCAFTEAVYESLMFKNYVYFCISSSNNSDQIGSKLWMLLCIDVGLTLNLDNI